MATEITVETPHGLSEVRTYFADFTNDLPTGVTVASATALHTPPSGTASTVTPSITLAPIVAAALGTQTVRGWHVLDIFATLSNGDVSQIRLHIPVNF